MEENQWNIKKLRTLLTEVITEERSFDNFLIEHRFKDLGRKRMRLNARLLRQDQTKGAKILLAIEDVTDKE